MDSKAIVSDQRRMRILSGKVEAADSSPVVTGSSASGLSIVDIGAGTGEYELSFSPAFKRAPEIHLSAITDDMILKIITVTKSSAQIYAEDLPGGGPMDGDFYVWVVGPDTEDVI
jgi:hypothetical protein